MAVHVSAHYPCYGPQVAIAHALLHGTMGLQTHIIAHTYTRIYITCVTYALDALYGGRDIIKMYTYTHVHTKQRHTHTQQYKYLPVLSP